MVKIFVKIIPIAAFGFILFLGISFFNGFSLSDIFSNIFGKTTVSSQVLSEEIKTISELSTLRFDYADLVKHGKPKPSTGDYYVAIIRGYFKAGIDFSKIIIEEQSNSYIVTLPHSIITDGAIIKVDEKENDGSGIFFDDISKSKILDWQNSKHNSIKKELLESDFLDKSDTQAKEVITNFLKGLGLKNFTVNFS